MVNPRHRRSPRNQTLNNAYPEWYDDGGVFSSLVDAPWASDVSSASVDIAYHGEHSGMKFCAPLLYHFMDDVGVLTTEGKAAVARAIMARYGKKWSHLWELYSIEYSPLDSYKIVESRHRELERTDSVDETRTTNMVDTQIHPQKTVEKESLRTPNLEEERVLDEDSTSDSTDTRTANLSETKTIDDEESRSGTKTKTPNTTETKTVEEDTTDANTRVETPGEIETTVIDEEVVKAVDSTDTTTHGHVITTDNDTTEEVSDSKHGFNSATAVPTTGSSATGTNDTTETHSGEDVVVGESDETETKDATQTKTKSGTNRITDSGTGSKDITETLRRTGTEGESESETITKDGSEVTATTGTDTHRDIGSATKDSTETKTTTGTDRLEESETEKFTGTDSLTRAGTDSNEREGQLGEAEDIESTKAGNLFKAPAELMMADRDFWLTDFFSIVFEDVDQMLTLAIYSERTVQHTVLTE